MDPLWKMGSDPCLGSIRYFGLRGFDANMLEERGKRCARQCQVGLKRGASEVDKRLRVFKDGSNQVQDGSK